MTRTTQVAVILVGAFLAGHALAQHYPNRAITMIVGAPPGGGIDAVARPIANFMSKILGQPVVVENKPGAGTTLASSSVARAASDGYTIMVGAATIYGADQALYRGSVKYTAQDFTPVNRLTVTPMILAANSESGIRSVRELVARARAAPGRLRYASSGNGVPPHIAAVNFEKLTGVKMEHVPYKGGVASVVGVMGGEAELTFSTPAPLMPVANSGRIRLLAVTTHRRSPLFPHLPTIAESGVSEFDLNFWFGLFGPKGLPKEAVDKLFHASSLALKDPEVIAQLAATGNEALSSVSPAEFHVWAAREGLKAKELTERSGAKID